jgi:hypothetical protein
MTESVRTGNANDNVIWLDPWRERDPTAPSLLVSLAALIAFALAAFLAVSYLSNAIVAWIGHDRSVALSFISASAFL